MVLLSGLVSVGYADPPMPAHVEDASVPATSVDSKEDASDQPAVRSLTASEREEPCGDQLSDGIWIHRSINGRALAKGEYRSGVRHGIWTRYFAPGESAAFQTSDFHDFEPPFTLEAEFTAGKLEGLSTFRDAKGRMVATWELRNNVVHGEVVFYFANGAVRQGSTFRNGFLHGEQVAYDSENKIVERAEFAEGLRLIPHKELWASSQVSCTGAYVDARKRTIANFDWWHGVAELTAIDGEAKKLKHGKWTWYDEHGQMQLQGTYQEGTPVGVFTWWYENGQRQLAGTYANGQPDGEFVWWHPNGQKQLSVTYVAGKQSGSWMSWDTLGVVVEKSDRTVDPLAQFFAAGEPIVRPTAAANVPVYPKKKLIMAERLPKR
jgi:antitoxin component YwqK of YwqJK toxin-antitoxin module